MQDIMTMGDLSRRFGLPVWKIRRVYQRGLLPEPERVVSARVVGPADLPMIEAVLLRAGYIAAALVPASA